MTTLLGLLIYIALAIVSLKPEHAVPLDPQSIYASAKLLAASRVLSLELVEVNGHSIDQIQLRLESRAYQSILKTKTNRKNFGVASYHYNHNPSGDQKKQASHSKAWWQPVISKIWFALITVLVPLAIIAALSQANVLNQNSCRSWQGEDWRN
jgi:hypothetical protein